MAAMPPPVILYHFKPAWNGFPADRMTSGWHALALEPNGIGAETGISVFLSYWHADKQCWGSEKDCRPPAWGIENRLSYIGPVGGAETRLKVERR